MIHPKELFELAMTTEHSDRVDIAPLISQQTGYPLAVIKQGISQGQLKVNGVKVFRTVILLAPGAVVTFQSTEISYSSETKFDKYIGLLLSKNFESKSISKLSVDEKNKFCAYALEYFVISSYQIEELSESKFNDEVMLLFEEFFKANFQVASEGRLPRRKDLIDRIGSIRQQEIEAFKSIVTQIVSEAVDINSQKPFQDISHFVNRKGFKMILKPILLRELDLLNVFQSILRNYKLIANSSTSTEKISNRAKAFEEFDRLLARDLKDDRNVFSKGLRFLIQFIKKKADTIIGYKDTGKVFLEIRPEKRTYNLSSGRFTVHAIIENKGTGEARNVRVIQTNDQTEIPNQTLVDIFPPGDTRNVKFIVRPKTSPTAENLMPLSFKLQWENSLYGLSEFHVRDFILEGQDENLRWEELKRTNPYNLSIVDDPNRLFGRERLLNDLMWNIDHNATMMSFVIYGQKRVGKSSIIRTLDTIYRDKPNIIFTYKTIGDVKNTDPSRTLQKLGESIATKIVNEFKRKNPGLEFNSAIVTKQSFVGSISALSEIVDHIHDLNEGTRIVIALDEFDELNKEFFENGELGKTFALNIGKGLNEKAYVSFILIGSESMELKTRQGMRLNAFETKKVDTFDKKSEFDAYCKIITEPTKSCLIFSSDVPLHLYHYTNGNPYYTNVLMDKIFRELYDKRISHVDIDFVSESIKHMVESILTKKDFEHFWNDGLSEEAVSFERILDRRRRFLTAFSQVMRENSRCTWSDVRKKIKYPKKFEVTEIQMENTLNEFKQRNIVLDSEGVLEIVPRLFQDWILGNGLYQVIAQLEDKDEILDKVLQEEKLLVTDVEISEVLTSMNDRVAPGSIGSFRKFLNTFEDNSTKRLVVDFLRKMVIIKESELPEFLGKIRKEIWGSIELGIGHRDIRSDAEVVCFEDSFEQNRSLAESIKSEFRFIFNKNTKRPSDLQNLADTTRNLIVFEPLVDCQYFYKNEFSKLVKRINPRSARDLRVFLLAYIITDEAKAELEQFMAKNFAFEFKIYSLRILPQTDICPYLNTDDAINDQTWLAVTQNARETHETSCIVKIGGMFPYQCFPMLWSSLENLEGTSGKDMRLLAAYRRRMSLSVKLKELSFTNESKELELKASLSEPAPNWKVINEKAKQLRVLPSDKAADIQALGNDLENMWLMRFSNAEKNKAALVVKHAIAKTLAAFSNTNGGELYVGIDDDLTTQGLFYDVKVHKTNEALFREFDTIVTNYLGVSSSGLFHLDFIELDWPVLRITCRKSPSDVWVHVDKTGVKLEAGKVEFYIRSQQETRQLSIREYSDWKAKQQ